MDRQNKLKTMESILTLDIGSSSMRAIHHDSKGRVLNKCRRSTVPDYQNDTCVELDANHFVRVLISLLKKVQVYTRENHLDILCISVTSQRSSVVPVNKKGEPLAPFITWHDKRTVSLCHELSEHEKTVYTTTGLRITPVLSAVKMTWFKRERPDIYQRTAKMLGFHDLALFTLCGNFITDHSLASNTNLLNLQTCEWSREMMDIFSVNPSHLCDLVKPGSICGTSTKDLFDSTGIKENTPIISAGGDQQCSALGLGIMSNGDFKCTTGTGSYLVAYTDTPIIDDKQRFLCKVGAIPGTYNLEAGLLTAGTVYRWFLEQFYNIPSGNTGVETLNQEVLSSPPGANGVLLLPHFEGSGAPHWNPMDTGVFYKIKLSTTRADMARAVLEGIVMEMGENIALFKEELGRIFHICVSGGMTKFGAYNQLQADVYGERVIVNSNKESTSLGAWISAAVTLGMYDSYDAAYQASQTREADKVFDPNPDMTRFYETRKLERKKLYKAMQYLETELNSAAKESDNSNLI